MALIEHDDMMEQIAATIADEALRNAVLPWASNRSANWGDA